MKNKSIYFICTGNSCRSQIAEGFGKEILGSDWEVYSGGIEAHGLNPNAIQAMDEVGIDIRTQESNTLDMDLFKTADLVVTLCSDADQNCPMVPVDVKKEHWAFDDPAGKDFSEFQRVRDEIKNQIESFKQNNRIRV